MSDRRYQHEKTVNFPERTTSITSADPAVRIQDDDVCSRPTARERRAVYSDSSSRTHKFGHTVEDVAPGLSDSAEKRTRRFLTPHKPAPDSTSTGTRSYLAPSFAEHRIRRNFRRDHKLYSSDRAKKSEERRSARNKADSDSELNTDNPRRYIQQIETVDSSSSADSSDKRVRFQDQIRRNVVATRCIASPELVVGSESDTSLASSSSNNLLANSLDLVSISSGTGSLQDLQVVDYSRDKVSSGTGSLQDLQVVDYSRDKVSSGTGSLQDLQVVDYSRDKVSSGTGSLQDLQVVDYSRDKDGQGSRLTRLCSSNDSDYSTENESPYKYNTASLNKNEAHYSINDSFKSSAYAIKGSSSSVKGSLFSYAKSDQSRVRVKCESSEDERVTQQIQTINLEEVHEELQSSASNSTLTDSSSSSESEVVVAAGIVIRREKFTSGSEFESSSSGQDNSTDNDGSWIMTVTEHHRASSPLHFDEGDGVFEKEIIFKFKESRKETLEQISQPHFAAMECVEVEELEQSAVATSSDLAFVKPVQTKPTPKPVELIVESLSDSSSDEIPTAVRESFIGPVESSAPIDLASLKSETLLEVDSHSGNSISLTHVTTLEGSLTQTGIFTLPNMTCGMLTSNLEHTTSTRAVYAPHDLVRQFVKENEALFRLQQENKLNKLVSYSCSSLSSFGSDPTEYLTSSAEIQKDPATFAPRYFYDSFGNKKHVMVSTGTSTEFVYFSEVLHKSVEGQNNVPIKHDLHESSNEGKHDTNYSFGNRGRDQNFPFISEIAAVEILLMDSAYLNEYKSVVSVHVQTDRLSSSKSMSSTEFKSHPSAFKKFENSSVSSDLANTDVTISDADGFIATTSSIRTAEKEGNATSLHTAEDKAMIVVEAGSTARKVPLKRFAYREETYPADVALAGTGQFVTDFSAISSSSDLESVISFHEWQPQIVSSSDLFKELSPDQSRSDSVNSNYKAPNSDPSSLSSDTEELRVILKLSRDLSVSDTSHSDGGSNEEDAGSEETSAATSKERSMDKGYSFGLNAGGKQVDDSDDEISLSGESTHSKTSVTTSTSVNSTDQRLIEKIFNDVEEMINYQARSEDKDEKPQENLDKRVTSESSVSNELVTSDKSDPQLCSSYSAGELLTLSQKSSRFDGLRSPSAPSVTSPSPRTTETRRNSSQDNPSEVDRYLLYLRDRSASPSSSTPNPHKSTKTKTATVTSDPKSEFERLHEELKEMFDSHMVPITRTTNSPASSTLNKISVINSSDSETRESDRSKDDISNSRIYRSQIPDLSVSDSSVSDKEDQDLERDWQTETESEVSTNTKEDGQSCTLYGMLRSSVTSQSSEDHIDRSVMKKIAVPSYGSEDDELSPDELDNPQEGEGDIQPATLCDHCNCETCDCTVQWEDSEITESSRLRKRRWKENYGVLRALRWIFCPCRDA